MRVLIIRFSSFGDIFQALEAARHLKTTPAVGRAVATNDVASSTNTIDWLVREDFAPLLENQKWISNVYAFNRRSSALALIALAWGLAPQYERVYDAHSNLRSALVRTAIRIRWFFERVAHPFSNRRSMIRRSKERLRRFLFFKLRLATLPMPYRGAESFLRPLRRWIPDLEFDFSVPAWTPPKPNEKENPTLLEFKNWLNLSGSPLIALAPSAAWPNKRWPIERWRLFVREWIETSRDTRFLLLGGPDDRFLDEIEKEFGQDRVFNAVGRTSMLESATLLSQADGLVANDTGLLHVADRLLLPSVEIVGPTAFGYPVSPVSRVAEVPRESLPCKPCSKDGRDPCTNAVHLKCLKDVSPSQVVRELRAAFDGASEHAPRLPQNGGPHA